MAFDTTLRFFFTVLPFSDWCKLIYLIPIYNPGTPSKIKFTLWLTKTFHPLHTPMCVAELADLPISRCSAPYEKTEGGAISRCRGFCKKHYCKVLMLKFTLSSDTGVELHIN